VVSTGSLGLDLALASAGCRAAVVRSTAESSGKTTSRCRSSPKCKKAGHGGLLRAENALDVTYPGKLGVKTEDLLISQPEIPAAGAEIADMLVRSGGST